MTFIFIGSPRDVMVACSTIIIHGLSTDPKAMATALHTKGFIGDGTLNETDQLNETSSNKGRRLYTAVLQVVTNYPDRYDHFLSVLQQTLTRKLYSDLHQKLTAKGNYKL